VLDQLDPSTQMDQYRRGAASPQVVVGSVHAVTEDGQLLVASASGSQLAAYAFGAAQVIWVVGAQKVVPDLDTAFQRVRRYSYPLEDVRARAVYGFPSAINKQLLISGETPGRAHVVLVGEVLGF
jgi:L-lactate utilization protein LutC